MWQPHRAERWKVTKDGDWYAVTPALLLIHEFGHAYHHIHAPDPDKWIAIQKTDDGTQWNNDEEKNTIIEIENIVAGQLTKSGGKEGKRFYHDHYNAAGPAVWEAITALSSISIGL
jgi:hypothetical protein